MGPCRTGTPAVGVALRCASRHAHLGGGPQLSFHHPHRRHRQRPQAQWVVWRGCGEERAREAGRGGGCGATPTTALTRRCERTWPPDDCGRGRPAGGAPCGCRDRARRCALDVTTVELSRSTSPWVALWFLLSVAPRRRHLGWRRRAGRPTARRTAFGKRTTKKAKQRAAMDVARRRAGAVAHPPRSAAAHHPRRSPRGPLSSRKAQSSPPPPLATQPSTHTPARSAQKRTPPTQDSGAPRPSAPLPTTATR